MCRMINNLLPDTCDQKYTFRASEQYFNELFVTRVLLTGAINAVPNARWIYYVQWFVRKRLHCF